MRCSVAMSTYNGAAYLAEQLDSIFAQTRPVDEIVISDDGSTDQTLAIVGDNGGALAQSLAAGSFRDSTRVAGTQPSLVQAMCETNADAVVAALDEALELLHDARDSLAKDRPDLTALAETGYAARVRFEARHGARGESVSPVKISSRPLLRLHPGTPGWVRQLEQAESLGGRIDIF